MTLKTRLMAGLLAVLVALALAPSSFAQVNITLLPDTAPAAHQTSRAAQIAPPGTQGAGILVQGTIVAPSGLTTATLRLTFPGAITSDRAAGANIPVGDPIRIEGQTGLFAGMTTAADVTLSAPVITPDGTPRTRVDIRLPGFPTTLPNTQSGTFRLVGVRLDATGLTAPVNATASITTGGITNYNLLTTSATVITALSPPLASMAIGARSGQPNLGTATILTNRTVPDQQASFLITEGFASSFRNLTQLGNSGVAIGTTGAGYNSTRVRLTFAGVPTGVTLTLSIDAPGSLTVPLNATFVDTGTQTTTITPANLTRDIEIVGSSTAATESLNVNIAAISVSTTAAVTTPGAITVAARMIPNCTTILSDAATPLPITTNGYPCFAEDAGVGPITVVNIVPISTTMLIPYATVLSPFDTGIAIANTTADPFGSGGGATPQAGTITFDFFPSTATGAGTSFSVTTSSTIRPGAGLSSDGTLAAGATFTALLSEVLTAAGQTGNFIGYIFIRTNFAHAHGVATITDFRTFSLATHVLVLPAPSTTPRAGGTEALSH
jgi:hypothetical protein